METIALIILTITISLLIDIPIIKKITGWRLSTILKADVFINLTGEALSLVIFTVGAKYLFFLTKIIAATIFPFVYLGFEKLSIILLFILAPIPILIIKPSCKAISLKAFSLITKNKQKIGFRGFSWLLLASALATWATLMVTKLPYSLSNLLTI